MNPIVQKHRITSTIILLVASFFGACFFFFALFPGLSSAVCEVEVNSVSSPEGAVILIIDGLSAPYVYPELTPYALDGSPLEKARLENIPEISENSARILEFRVPQTFTEGGHSVLVTGNSKADSEIVSFKDATIFDILHKNGYLCIAVMEKGDSWSICAEQDAILRDANNSMADLQITLEQYDHTSISPDPPRGLLALMEKRAEKAPEYVSSKETKDRYSGYNRWGIDVASAIVEYMRDSAKGQKYLLTINVGAVDMSGHYRGSYGYIDCIETLDSDLSSLYNLCTENNIAFFLTGDHGMCFTSDGSKGGHEAEKYSVTEEAQLVPLLVHAADVKNGVIEEPFRQEDFAPTLLGVLDISESPRFADGEQIPLKEHVNLKVELPAKGRVEVLKAGNLIASAAEDDEFIFSGLESEATYLIRATLENGETLEEAEKEEFLNTDSIIGFKLKGSETQKESSEGISGNKTEGQIGIVGNNAGFSGSKQLIGYFLIGMINLGGLAAIAKVLKKK